MKFSVNYKTVGIGYVAALVNSPNTSAATLRKIARERFKIEVTPQTPREQIRQQLARAVVAERQNAPAGAP